MGRRVLTGCGGSQQQGRVWEQPQELSISSGPGPGQPQLGHHPTGGLSLAWSASRQGRAVGRWRPATGTDSWGLEWAVGHDRMGEALEEEHLRCSMQLQAHLQPSCSPPWAALSALAGFCWQLADRQVFSSKLNTVLKPKITMNSYMSIHMVSVQFGLLELSIRKCLLFIRRTWV